MTAAALGAALGLVAGIIPGPFFTLVAVTSVRQGFRDALRLAFVPLGTEIPALLASIFLLTQLPHEGLRWMGIVGGGLLLYLAWRVVNAGRDRDGETGGDEEDADRNGVGEGVGFPHAVAFGLISPTPWVFWFLVGGPITMNRWYEGAFQAVIFVGSFLGLFVASLAGVAWVAASTGRRVGPTGSRRLLFGAGAALALAGVALAWQSWIGNFAEWVGAPEQIEERIG